MERIEAYAAKSPLATWLGFKAAADAETFTLTFNEAHIGNPAIKALHGGVISAFLEFVMQADLTARTGGGVSTVNMSIEYLSSSRPENMTARVRLLKEGRRIAYLEAEGWQSDETRLVAVARGCFKLG